MFVALVVLNEFIFPVPEVERPIVGLLLVQLKLVPGIFIGLTKFSCVIALPEQTVCEDGKVKSGIWLLDTVTETVKELPIHSPD
jgi:hypothetical protein